MQLPPRKYHQTGRKLSCEKAVKEKIEAVRLERHQLELQEIAEKQTLISLKQQEIEEQ
jgi:hypothetical protein